MSRMCVECLYDSVAEKRNGALWFWCSARTIARPAQRLPTLPECKEEVTGREEGLSSLTWILAKVIKDIPWVLEHVGNEWARSVRRGPSYASMRSAEV